MVRIGLVINPIAGMGGKVGLKGTDGVAEEAARRGALPRAPDRAKEALSRLHEAYARHRLNAEVTWIAPEGEMGSALISGFEVDPWNTEILTRPGPSTSAGDTRDFVKRAVKRGVDLIVFCGGDGTARDVFGEAGGTAIFGIPSGVKMHSGVFANDPRTAGELLEFYIRGELTTGDGEIMDLDEDLYRKGEWNIALFGIARTLFEPSFIQTGKFMVEEASVESFIQEICDDITESMEEETGVLYILGPGGTLHRIGQAMGIDSTHLGVDLVREKTLVAKDVDERTILEVIDGIEKEERLEARIIVSPIGGQGFFLGRGNLQISPEVIERVGPKNVLVVSVPQKLDGITVLKVDTGKVETDEWFRSLGSVKVLTGYRTYRMKKIE